MDVRNPFSKNIEQVPIEDAHGGSGSRRLLLSKDDPVSQHLHAMTKGYLNPSGVWDWHHHQGVDEFFVVIQGSGTIQFRDKPTVNFKKDDLVYIPADCEHRIKNTGSEVGEFYFIRIDS